MSGYVDAGYAVVLGTLGVYGVVLLARERAARRRLPAGREAEPASPARPGIGATGDGHPGVGEPPDR